MNKADAKRNEITDKLADFVLSQGLSGANLRPLAAAAGTSDRMLLYYFKDKEDIISACLGRVAQRLAEKLLSLGHEPHWPPGELEAGLLALTAQDDWRPYMCVWLETASLAARGDPLYRSIGRQIALGFRSWISGLLALNSQAKRDETSLRILRTIEGAILLQAVGLEATAPAAD